MEEMNQFGIQYFYSWKCHNETQYRYLQQAKVSPSKMRNRKAKQVFW
jgi:hypothetical protein